jgi:hypothetical protein
VVAKAPTRAFEKRGFTGTIMGTMVFVAQSKRLPLGVKIGAPLLLVAALVTGGHLWMQQRSRNAAVAQLDAALALPDAEALARARTLDWDALPPEARVRLIVFLAEQRDGPSMARLLEALDDRLDLQRAAVGAVAAIGSPAGTPAGDRLAELLEAEDVGLRRDAAWALVRIGDGRGIEPTLATVAAGTPPDLASYDPRTLASMMGRDGLLERLRDPSPTLRQFAVYHLGDVCRPEDAPAIASVAADDDVSTADTALVTLARCDSAAAAPLVRAALEPGPARWNGLYTRMRSDAGAAGLGLLLPYAPDAPAHRWIVHEMAVSLDPRAADALHAELLRVGEASVQDRLDTALALGMAGDARVSDVVRPLLEGDDESALAAIRMLGLASSPDLVEPTLVALSRDGSEARRRAAIDAMASTRACGEVTQRQLTRLVGQRAFRSNALVALARCGSSRAAELAEREVTEPLASPITHEAGEYRLAALEAVATMARAGVADPLYAQLLAPDTDPRIRTATADALAVLATDAMRDRALDRLLDPEVPRPVRFALRRMLGSGISSSSVPRLLGFVRGGASDDRTTDAAIVLGLAHHAESRSELVVLLDDDRARRHAALTLMLGGDEDTAGALARRVEADSALQETLAADLDPSPWPFVRGRSVTPHLASAVPLRDHGFVAPLSNLCEALTEPADGLLAPSAIELRRALLETLTTSGSAPARALAAEGLACSGARSAVLDVRDGRGTGAVEARRALSQIRPED